MEAEETESGMLEVKQFVSMNDIELFRPPSAQSASAAAPETATENTSESGADHEDGSESESESSKSLYCICRSNDSDGFMIQCDQCADWFHGRCVSMNPRKSKLLATWVCPVCTGDDEYKSKTAAIKEDAATASSEEDDSPIPPPSKVTAKAKPTSKPSSRKSSIKPALGALKTGSAPKNVSGSKPALTSPVAGLVSPSSPTAEAIRKRVQENMKKLFRSGLQSIVEKKEEMLPDDLDVDKLALQVEEAMWDAFTAEQGFQSDAYKQKFQSLYTNLRQAGNIVRVLSGEISAERLVGMSVEELASAELQKIREAVLEEKARQTVMTEQQAAVVLKKTTQKDGGVAIKEEEKPIESLSQDTNISPIVSAHLAIDSGLSAMEGVDASTTPPLSTTPSVSNDGKDNSTRSSSADIESSTAPPLAPMEASVAPPPPQISHSMSLEDLLSKVDSRSLIVPTVPSKRKQEDEQQRENAKKYGEEESEKKDVPRSNIWSGKVDMPTVGGFEAHAVQVGGSEIKSAQHWEQLLPAKLTVEGRIQMKPVCDYLDQVTMAGSKEILLIEIGPADNILFDYFHSRARFGVVGHKMTNVKDMYLVPLKATDPLPNFMFAMEHEVQFRRTRDVFLGVMVVARDTVQAMAHGADEKAMLKVKSKDDHKVTAAAAASKKADVVKAPLIPDVSALLDTLKGSLPAPAPEPSSIPTAVPISASTPAPPPPYYAPPPSMMPYGSGGYVPPSGMHPGGQAPPYPPYQVPPSFPYHPPHLPSHAHPLPPHPPPFHGPPPPMMPSHFDQGPRPRSRDRRDHAEPFVHPSRRQDRPADPRSGHYRF